MRLGTELGAAEIDAHDADAVIVATGAARRRPDVPGIDLPHVVDGDALRDLLVSGSGSGMAALSTFGRLSVKVGRTLGLTADPERLAQLTHHYMPLGKQVVVLGGGLVGIELAEFLVHRGRSVTVLEEGEKLALEMAHPRRWRVLHDLREDGADLITEVGDISIEKGEVRYRVSDREERVSADHVVVATGLEADRSLADELRERGVDPIEIGDCTGVGYIEGAIHDGFHAAARL